MKRFDALVGDISPERRAAIDEDKKKIMAEVRLHELRKARMLSQETIAGAMGVPQSAISKLERRSDNYISTVRRYLEAMGGELHIVASFPDGNDFEIQQFSDLVEEPQHELIEA
jgi:transcriptional regulator with XRE-family HTH domain